MRGHRGGYASAKVPQSEMKPPPASACTTKSGGEHENEGGHHFSTDDGVHCVHCGGYPYALVHWTLG